MSKAMHGKQTNKKDIVAKKIEEVYCVISTFSSQNIVPVSFYKVSNT